MTLEPVRFSRLKLIGKAPAKYKQGYGEETSCMSVGTAAHSNVIGGKNVIFYPGKVRNGGEWEKFEADHPNDTILTRREFAIADGMAKAVKASKLAMSVLDGEREKTILFDKEGRACRATPDVNNPKFITELKTGETSDPALFRWKVLRFCYHGQEAWYDEAVGGRDNHYIVAVEDKPPFIVTVFRLTPGSIEQGRKLCRLWWERLLQCEAANEWPGYCQSIVDLDVGETELVFGDDE